MKKAPLCCSPVAYKRLKSALSTLESSDALLLGAVGIASHALPQTDPASIDSQIQALADAIRQRVRGTQPQALLAHLHDHLFDEQGFDGNREDYYNADNSYLPHVLSSRRGLPITLSLIYKLVAERLGFRSWGIGLPGHFIAGIEVDGQRLLVDPFCGGRILTADECRQKLTDIFGDGLEFSSDMLEPIDHRQWLTRILQNLLHVHASAERFNDVAAVLEMEMLLWPEKDSLQRDLALTLARLGMSKPATEYLDIYLKNHPDDPQKADLQQLLDVLR